VLRYEVYRDDAAFHVHWNGTFVARLREEAAGMIGLRDEVCTRRVERAPRRSLVLVHPLLGLSRTASEANDRFEWAASGGD
jgi:hypothetical protein